MQLGVALFYVLRQQFPAPDVDALVHAAQIQQIVEHIVAGDDTAPLPDGGRKRGGGLRCAQMQVVVKKGAAVIDGLPGQRRDWPIRFKSVVLPLPLPPHKMVMGAKVRAGTCLGGKKPKG